METMTYYRKNDLPIFWSKKSKENVKNVAKALLKEEMRGISETAHYKIQTSPSVRICIHTPVLRSQRQRPKHIISMSKMGTCAVPRAFPIPKTVSKSKEIKKKTINWEEIRELRRMSVYQRKLKKKYNTELPEISSFQLQVPSPEEKHKIEKVSSVCCNKPDRIQLCSTVNFPSSEETSKSIIRSALRFLQNYARKVKHQLEKQFLFPSTISVEYY